MQFLYPILSNKIVRFAFLGKEMEPNAIPEREDGKIQPGKFYYYQDIELVK